MSTFLTEAAPETLARAIDENQIAQQAALGLARGATLRQDADLTWFFTGLLHPMFNGVLTARFQPGEVEARVREMLDFFRKRRAPMMWWTGPLTRPTDLDQHLLRLGLTHAGDQPGMAVDTRTLAEEVPGPPGFSIERAGAVADLESWSQVVRTGFDLPKFAARTLVDHFQPDGPAGGPAWRHYLGRLNGRPVASSTLFIGAGVAGIYYVACLPEFRRQGLATAMTLTPLLEARHMGLRFGVLQASDQGAGLYRRLGFQTYCRLRRFIA